MKKSSFQSLLILPFVVLILTACNSGISNNAIKNALNNEEKCLKVCDEMEDKAIAESEKCRKDAIDWAIEAVKDCTTPICVENVVRRLTEMLKKCDEEYKTQHAGVRQCRTDCRARFPLEIGYKSE